MQKRLALPLIVACLSLGNTAWGDEQGMDNASADAANRTLLTTSPYPQRWCIKTFLAHSRSFARLPVSRRLPAAPLYSGLTVTAPARDVPDHYDDVSSLANRLKALELNRLMTLWQGRDRALVVGVQDGGYLGLSLSEAKPDEQ